MEFYLFKYLFENRNTIVTRNMIFDRLKGLDGDGFDRSIDVLVSRLRARIGDDPREPTLIRTVRGKGYRFIG
ncbi:MAG: winged helix-turn-helix domain-containing protein [Spirochaetota bacterium]